MGMYNILGMEKRHIGRILLTENGVVSLAALVCGIGSGLLFSKLVHLVLSHLFDWDPPFGIAVSWPGVLITAILFSGTSSCDSFGILY